MEYCNQGTLIDFVKKYCLEEDQILKYFSQIVEAFRYLHDRDEPIVHRDIKPENILLNNNIIKLSDFGHARSWNNQVNPTLLVGTCAYNSP